MKSFSQRTIGIIALVAILTVSMFYSLFSDTLFYSVATENFVASSPSFDGGSMMQGESFMGAADAMKSAPMEQRTMIEESSGTATGNVERLIIKTGTISLEVDDVKSSIQSLSTLATSLGGFVVYSTVNVEDISPNGSITLRIPSEVFDQGVGNAKGLGRVINETVQGNDVTEEYVDLSSQLTNLTAAETQFLSIMKQAVKIEDILAVQRELTNVRSQIEQIEGRLAFLKESASLSSLTIYLSTKSESLPILEEQMTWQPVAVVKDALRQVLLLAASVANAIIWFVVFIPVWGIGIGIFFVARFIFRKYIVRSSRR